MRSPCPAGLALLLAACHPAGDSGPTTPPDTGEAPPRLESLELPPHPRVLVDEDLRDLLEARVAGADADPTLAAEHAELVAALRARCDAALPEIATDPIDLGATWSGAAQARDCAFFAWLERDAERGAKAATILERLPTDAHANEDITEEVHLATAVTLASQAWDLLAGADLALDLEPSRATVAALAGSLWQAYVEDWPQLYQAWQNNHNIKTAASLGLAALALDDEPLALTWLGYAQTEVQRIQLEVQATPGGAGYGEGPGYQSYAAQTAQPYLLAYHRLFPGSTFSWPITCATRPDGSCEDGDREIVGDLWEDERLLAQLLWNTRLRMPDGARPPFDDSWRTGFPTGMMAGLDPELAWDWVQTADAYHSWAADVGVETLLALDSVGEAPTHDPCWADPETGVAVLATGHDPDASWAMLLAEPPGPMTSWGHEHADAGTIQLYARGSYLVLDPAYPGYDRRMETAGYEHHAGILVGGEGLPSGTAGDLEVAWDQDLTGCEAAATLSWSGHDWRRHVALEQGALVVRDDLALAEALATQWRLPTISGEGRGTMTLEDFGAVLRQEDAALLIAVSASAPSSLDIALGPDAPTWGSVLEHQLLTATTEPVEQAWFFAVLLPIAPDAEPVVGIEGDTIEIDGARWSR